MSEKLEELKGKKVYIQTQKGREYIGIVNSIEIISLVERKIHLTDLKNRPVIIDYSNVAIIQEERQ